MLYGMVFAFEATEFMQRIMDTACMRSGAFDINSEFDDLLHVE